MDLISLRTSLRRKVGNPTTTDVADSALTEHINNAYRDLATSYPFHQSRRLCYFMTAVGTTDYGLPDAAGAVLKVWDETNDKKLDKVGMDQLSRKSVTATNGKPEQYVRIRDFVRIVTREGGGPDGAYKIWVHYRENITDLVADGDVPVLATPWHPGIVMLARWYYYDDQGDIPKAQYAMESYEKWLKAKPSETEEETVDIDSGVRLPTLAARARKVATDGAAWDAEL